MQALATVADLKARYDVRRLADLSSDTGVRMSPSDIDGSNTILQCLVDATAMILSAVRVSNRYTTADLYGDSSTTPDTPGSSMAVRLCCDLAFGLLTARRGYSAKELESMAPLFLSAQQQLELLRRGDRILDTYRVVNGVVVADSAVAEAGLPKSYRILPGDDASLLTANNRYFGFRISGGGPYPRRDAW
jgi:phage gp36-like protein